jgi:hypothetical protein
MKDKVNKNKEVKISNARVWVGWDKSIYLFPFSKIIGSSAKRTWRAGKKEGGLGEGIFARPLPLGGGWACVAFGDAQASQSFVQKRFVLRSVIATKCNFYHFWWKVFARSPRLRLGSLCKFPYILELNQMGGQNQKLFFYQVGGGSAS